MPIIKPFKAVRYNISRIKDLSQVVSPPYDVIPDHMQDKLYRSHPQNVVRLILNKIENTDDEKNNRYIRAGKLFESWINENILSRDSEDALYVYSQAYKYDKKDITQIGFIGLMGLDLGEGTNKILPHENTLAAPKADRLCLMRQVKANLSPVFVLYEDNSHKITSILKKECSKKKPVIDVVFDNVSHKVWKLEEAGLIEKIEELMRRKSIFIADGHHRYEVARTYSGEAQDENSKYIMTYFVEADERMLSVLPAHRVVKDTGGLKKEEIEKRLEKFFHIEKVAGLKNLMSRLSGLRNAHAFGMYLGGSGYYILKLKNTRESDKVMEDRPMAWKRLDVAILHIFIFQHLLGIRDEDDNIEFLKSADDTAASIDRGEGKAAFFLNPTKVSDVKRIAKTGERMPRKATYFYPKPLSGLVINKFSK